MAYSTQADLEKWLQIDFTVEPEPVVTLLLAYAEAVIDNYTDRTFHAVAGDSVTLDGRGDRILFLPQWPVTAVGSVVEDGVALAAGTDFYWYADGRLVRGSPDVGYPNMRWSRADQSVVVTYDHGYATIPPEIELVSTRIAGRMFQASAAYAAAAGSSSSGAVRSISLDGSDRVEFASAVADISTGLSDLDSIDRTILSRLARRGM